MAKQQSKLDQFDHLVVTIAGNSTEKSKGAFNLAELVKTHLETPLFDEAVWTAGGKRVGVK